MKEFLKIGQYSANVSAKVYSGTYFSGQWSSLRHPVYVQATHNTGDDILVSQQQSLILTFQFLKYCPKSDNRNGLV